MDLLGMLGISNRLQSCSLLHQTYFKESVPVHCAYMVSQTYNVVHIVFCSTFLYMKILNDVLLFLYDCIKKGCLQISVQPISINIWTLIPQNIVPLKCWRDFAYHFSLYWIHLHICTYLLYLIKAETSYIWTFSTVFAFLMFEDYSH